ncbi:RagB/SusD family nutrient uptake outer membrane protein [Mucilaginibacter terrae]|uniref:Tetratricopeptide (TPR) repeat protein n=1 Tax=Mucilaginibacter terrae TaxID=1955052 RepID=A0ABU3GRJ7_9SPHI|nr:RagB/SusD family nutrient uptake outer membrane protein [Mucilaginibacter terrae]MDT3401255.1 tetratricopeptide (TPR) repeat protein [Mucilaginibacter terrae]
MKKNIIIIVITATVAFCMSCSKYLDEKSDKKLVVPVTLADFQALLDNHTQNVNREPADGEISADDYYLTDASFNSLTTEGHKRTYTWQKDYLIDGTNYWMYSYFTVYSANSVLEGTENIVRDPANREEWGSVTGHAYFLRAKSFLNLANIWVNAYDGQSPGENQGLPLRLNSDFNERSVRSTIHQTYAQILSDLKMAATLLPITPKYFTRPGKPAAFALLARTYLYMGNYQEAAVYADSCLQMTATRLIDFNSLSASANFPISQNNVETILYSVTGTPAPISQSRALIVPELYNQYENNDLRKSIYFRNNNNGTFSFKGNYSGSGTIFGGIVNDEVYLMRAEANARLGNVSQAMNDLNTLMIKRWRTGTFVPFTANNSEDAVKIILRERRKELLMRTLRWPDLKRLNKSGAGISLSRTVNGTTYTLPPNDLRYALPIPEDVIQLSGMPQNPR